MTGRLPRTRRPLRAATGGAPAIVSAVLFAVVSTAVACAPGVNS